MLKLNDLHHICCMEAMKDIPNGYFDLAIVDPPYGLERNQRGSLRISMSNSKEALSWDIPPPLNIL